MSNQSFIQLVYTVYEFFLYFILFVIMFCLQEHVALFVRRRERTLGRVLAGGHGGRGSREEELLRPETERLVKQLE